MLVSLNQLLLNFNCNVLQGDQFTEVNNGISPGQVFQRIEFDYSRSAGDHGDPVQLQASLAGLANRFNMNMKVC